MDYDPDNVFPHGLLECGYDVGNCCYTCWCPCFAAGEIARYASLTRFKKGDIKEAVRRGRQSCISYFCVDLIGLITGAYGPSLMASCIWASTGANNRRALQEEDPKSQNKNENICLTKNFFNHCCCPRCALCQERKLIKEVYGGKVPKYDDNLQGLLASQAPEEVGGMTRALIL